MKTLFYVVNGEGLGHLNRCIVVADLLKNKDPGIEIGFMTNCKFNYWLEQRNYKYYQINKKNNDSEISRIVKNFNPEILVWDSSYNVSSLMKFYFLKIKQILILRKYKNEILERVLKTGEYNYFDLVLIPHSINEFKEYNIPSDIYNILIKQKKIQFVGAIVRKLKKTNSLSTRYDLNNKKFIITATLGGGGDKKTEEYFNLLIKTKEIIKKSYPEIGFIIIPGPYFKKCEGGSKKFEPELFELINISDLVICNAGYNTLNEVIFTRKPSLIFPIDKIDDDQAERAKRLVNRGLAFTIEGFNETQLSKLIMELYSNPTRLSGMRKKYSKMKTQFNSDNIHGAISKCYAEPFLLKSKVLKLKVYDKCNNHCNLCSTLNKFACNSKEDNIMDILKLDLPRDEVLLIGGEPTLSSDLLNILTKARELGYKTRTIESNGRRFSVRSYCKEIIKAGANKFIIYVFGKTEKEHDGITKVKGSFKETMKGIRNLRVLNQNVIVKLYDGEKFIELSD